MGDAIDCRWSALCPALLRRLSIVNVLMMASLAAGSAHAQEGPSAPDAASAQQAAAAPGQDAVTSTASASRDDTQAQEPGASQVLNTIPVKTAAQPAAPRSRETATRKIEEVIITAQKTAQSARDVPISVTAVSGDFMRDLGTSAIADIATYVPNLKFSSESETTLTQISIRGFGTSPLNSAFESSVGFEQDDVFFGRPNYALEGMFDIDHVEVLRGPQGTLFGKNTTAGVFNVITKRPSKDFASDLRVSYSDPEEQRIEAGVGGMFAAWGGIRVSLLDIDHPGGETYNTKLNRNEDKYTQQAQRIKLLLLPLAGMESELTAQRSSTQGNYWPLQLFNLADSTKTFLRQYDPRFEDNGLNHQVSEDFPGYSEKRSRTISDKTTWDIGQLGAIDRLVGTLVIGYSQFGVDAPPDLDTSPADIARLHTIWNYHQRSAELRFNGTFDNGLFGLGDSLDFIIGGFLFRSDFRQSTNVAAGEDLTAYLSTGDALRLASGTTATLPLPGLGAAGALASSIAAPLIGQDQVTLYYLLHTTTEALFGQSTWHISEKWALTPGVRINFEEKKADASGVSDCRLPPACLMRVALNASDYDDAGQHRKESDVSPKLSLQYFWNQDITLFSSFTRGYKSGGFNAASFNGKNLEFSPENVSAWEAGVKSTLFNRTLNFNITGFYENFKNLQTLSINGAFINVSNAATALSRGIEMDFLWLTPLDFLSVAGTLGILDATYDSYPDGQATVNQPAGSTQNLSGRTLPFAPRESASVSPTVTLPVFGLALQTSVDWLYTSSQYTDIDLDPHTRVPAHSLLSARISLADPGQAWSFTIGGSNLLDKQYAGQIVDAVFFPGGYNVTQQPGRKLFAAFTLKFQ